MNKQFKMDSVLYHTGRRGMKWYQHIFTNPDGSSKYQKSDGSLTAAGRSKAAVLRAKYNNLTDRNSKEAQQLREKYADVTGKQLNTTKKKTSGDTEKASNQNTSETKSVAPKVDYDLKKVPTSQLSNKDLQEAVTRINNKKTYDAYFESKVEPKTVSRGQKFLKAAGDIALEIVKDSIKDQGKKYLKQYISSVMDAKIEESKKNKAASGST